MTASFGGTPYVPQAPAYTQQPAPAVADARPEVKACASVVVAGLPTARFDFGGDAALVRRITVTCDNASRAFVYVGDPTRANLVCGTNAGQLDENDCNQPIFVPESTQLVVQWDAGAGTASARIEFARA